jgi:hypothetical protein
MVSLSRESRFPVVAAEPLIRLVQPDGSQHPRLRTLLESPYRDAVRKAVDELYRAFSSARLSTNFTGCPHCFTESDLRYVQETPVSSFTHDDLVVIGLNLGVLLGRAEDVPYFIPRLVEALAEGLAIDIEPLADQFVLIPESSWTPERKHALREVFHSLFDAGMRDYADGGPCGTFAESETRDYVCAKLAKLSHEPIQGTNG